MSAPDGDEAPEAGGRPEAALSAARVAVEAAEHERQRWARELHDQTLSGLGGLRGLLAGALEHGDERSLREVAHVALGLLASEIERLRHLIVELRPAELDDLGLGPAIEELARRHAVVDGLDVRLDIDLAYEARREPGRLSPDLEAAIYRVLQEALTNVARHAAAATVDVGLAERCGRVRLSVVDDGVGFDPAVTSSGLGLRGIRERAVLVGGCLELRSVRDQGSRLVLEAPALRRQGEA